MPNNVQETPIQAAWVNFVKSVQILLVPQLSDRALDQYLALRDAVLTTVRSEQFLEQLDSSWPKSPTPAPSEMGSALLLELQAFPRAVEVAQATSKPEETGSWWKSMLS